jgi:hypothetical protein
VLLAGGGGGNDFDTDYAEMERQQAEAEAEAEADARRYVGPSIFERLKRCVQADTRSSARNILKPIGRAHTSPPSLPRRFHEIPTAHRGETHGVCDASVLAVTVRLGGTAP